MCSLKQRNYLGPTSMDVQLSFVMAHQGLVQSGSVVMDPFVGTGSLLVACAARGAALTIGTDIDVRVLKGMNRIARETNSNIFTNFQQYALPPPCILRADNSKRGNVFRSAAGGTSSSGTNTKRLPFLDAIVCDPPYGVRAGAKKCGTLKKRKQPNVDLEYNGREHVTMTQKYETEDVMLDLLDMASSMLVMGGRLVYLLPCLSDFNSEEELPIHPCLKLIANSEQMLSKFWSRRLVTMEKVQEYDLTKVDEYVNIARERIRKAQSRHSQASVAYTDLQNKLKEMSRDAKKQKIRSGGGGDDDGEDREGEEGVEVDVEVEVEEGKSEMSEMSERENRKRKIGGGADSWTEGGGRRTRGEENDDDEEEEEEKTICSQTNICTTT